MYRRCDSFPGGAVEFPLSGSQIPSQLHLVKPPYDGDGAKHESSQTTALSGDESKAQARATSRRDGKDNVVQVKTRAPPILRVVQCPDSHRLLV
jgi:hypothetical protein